MAEVGGWDRWLWLGGSLLLAVVVAQATWRLERAKVRPKLVSKVLAWPYTPTVFLILRLLFYVGIPFAALIWSRGAVAGRRLGLQPLVALEGLFGEPASATEIAADWADWARDVGWAVGLGSAVWMVLALGWWAARKTSASQQQAALPASPGGLLLEAACHEVHWAFYRNAPIVALELCRNGSLGTYWGTWAGLGLTALEAALNPRWWADLASPRRAPVALVRAGMAVLSVALFLQTENLWLAVLTHWAVTWGMRKVQEVRSRE